MGSRGGGDNGEGHVAQWVVDHFWAGREKGERGERGWEAGELGSRNMPQEDRDASEGFCRPSSSPHSSGQASFPSWGGMGWPDSTTSRAAVDSGADPHWHVWGHRVHQSHEHKRKPQANSLTQDVWLDTDGQGNPEARWAPRPTMSLPVLFPGQSTSAELRASSRGRERARSPGR